MSLRSGSLAETVSATAGSSTSRGVTAAVSESTGRTSAALPTRSSTGQAVPSTPVTPLNPPLPTSIWTPGSPGDMAAMGGMLELDQQGCIVIGTTHLIWPAGFTAVRSGNETAILDAHGNVAAKVGWNVSFGGGVGINDSVGPCHPADSFSIQSDVGVPMPLYDQPPLEQPGPQSITGTLVAEPDGCVRLQVGTRVVDLVWPRYTAGTHVADGITVSKDGYAVHTGQHVQFMGDSGATKPAVADTCVSNPATAFLINSPADTWSSGS